MLNTNTIMDIPAKAILHDHGRASVHFNNFPCMEIVTYNGDTYPYYLTNISMWMSVD